MRVRQIAGADAPEISAFLGQLAAIGKRTNPSSVDYVREHYVEHPDNISCAVAVDDDGAILGFQVLKRAGAGNIYGVTEGWGIVGTHVRPQAARRGVGKALFSVTREAAQNAGLEKIDATIGAANLEGLAYYDALGFRTYRTPGEKICKCFEVPAS